MMAIAQTPIIVETLLPLTPDESKRFRQCEKIIERGLTTFFEVGNALAEIRESRLYRIQYASFEDYCRDRWHMSRFYAHRLIDAAQVVENLLPIGNVPLNESQARELARLEPDVQKAAWHIVLNSAPHDDEGNPMLTAAHIRSVANVMTEVVKAGGMDDGTGEVKPLGVLIDSAITEEVYERLQRQKQYIKEKLQQDAERAERQSHATVKDASEKVLSAGAREFLDDYMGELARWSEKIPPALPESEREALQTMIHDQGADVLTLRNRTVQADCEFIVKVVKQTGDGSTGDIDASKLYEWLLDLGYFISEAEYQDRLEYMNREDVRMALLTDAGKDGKQEDRRGKLPGIVCVPWRKVWNQTAKRPRDEDDDED